MSTRWQPVRGRTVADNRRATDVNIEATDGRSALQGAHVVRPLTVSEYPPTDTTEGQCLDACSQGLKGSQTWSNLIQKGPDRITTAPAAVALIHDGAQGVAHAESRKGVNCAIWTRFWDHSSCRRHNDVMSVRYCLILFAVSRVLCLGNRLNACGRSCISCRYWQGSRN